MKKIISIFCFLIFFFSNSQNKVIVKNWTSYVQAIDVKGKEKWNFRLSAKVKKENDNGNNCGIWCRIDRSDHQQGFFENMYYTTKVTNEWKTYEINGRIDENAQILNVGAFASDNGDFYFDDFKLEINDGKSKKWLALPLKNSGFEESLKIERNWDEGVVAGKNTHSRNFTIETSEKNPFEGKKSLLIKGRNIIGSMAHGKFVDCNGIKLYYETYGEGEPVLMLHGNGQSISAFMNQVEDFSKKYKVIIVDCRERGKSTYDKNVELTFDVQVEDLKQFLDKLNIKKTKILGWSDGGILAILMALKYPDMIDKIACSGANIFPEGIKDDYLKDMRAELTDLIKNNKDYKNDRLIDLYNLDLKYPNLKYEDLKNIQCQSLIIAGDKDEIKTEHTVKIAESIPKGQLAIIPHSSHYVPEEKPDLFNSLVINFFENK